MPPKGLLDEISRLHLEERIKLVEDNWDGIAATPEAVPVPDWHRAELDRRLDNPSTGCSPTCGPARPSAAPQHVGRPRAGLAPMVASLALAPRFVPGSTWLLVAGGLLSASGAYTFIYNLWRTIDGSAVARHDPAGVSATIALGRRSASRP